MDLTKRELTVQSLAAGAEMIRERPGLVGVLYVANLSLALILAFPFYSAFVDTVGVTAVGPELIQAFDLMLWQEILESMSGAFKIIALNPPLGCARIYGVENCSSHGSDLRAAPGCDLAVLARGRVLYLERIAGRPDFSTPQGRCCRRRDTVGRRIG